MLHRFLKIVCISTGTIILCYFDIIFLMKRYIIRTWFAAGLSVLQGAFESSSADEIKFGVAFLSGELCIKVMIYDLDVVMRSSGALSCDKLTLCFQLGYDRYCHLHLILTWNKSFLMDLFVYYVWKLALSKKKKKTWIV